MSQAEPSPRPEAVAEFKEAIDTLIRMAVKQVREAYVAGHDVGHGKGRIAGYAEGYTAALSEIARLSAKESHEATETEGVQP